MTRRWLLRWRKRASQRTWSKSTHKLAIWAFSISTGSPNCHYWFTFLWLQFVPCCLLIVQSLSLDYSTAILSTWKLSQIVLAFRIGIQISLWRFSETFSWLISGDLLWLSCDIVLMIFWIVMVVYRRTLDGCLETWSKFGVDIILNHLVIVIGEIVMVV